MVTWLPDLLDIEVDVKSNWMKLDPLEANPREATVHFRVQTNLGSHMLHLRRYVFFEILILQTDYAYFVASLTSHNKYLWYMSKVIFCSLKTVSIWKKMLRREFTNRKFIKQKWFSSWLDLDIIPTMSSSY